MVLTASVLAIVASFLTTALIGIIIIPILKRLKVGQSIKKIGPIWQLDIPLMFLKGEGAAIKIIN